MGTAAIASGDVVTIPESKLCEECKQTEWKYKCPGCELRSCGLACVKAHKTRTGCSGKRDRTAFVPLAEFCDNVLVSGKQTLTHTIPLIALNSPLPFPLSKFV